MTSHQTPIALKTCMHHRKHSTVQCASLIGFTLDQQSHVLGGPVMQNLVPLKCGPGGPSTYTWMVRWTICVYALMVPVGPPVYA